MRLTLLVLVLALSACGGASERTDDRYRACKAYQTVSLGLSEQDAASKCKDF